MGKRENNRMRSFGKVLADKERENLSTRLLSFLRVEGS